MRRLFQQSRPIHHLSLWAGGFNWEGGSDPPDLQLRGRSDARSASLLPGAVVAMDRALLDRLVDAGDQSAMLGLDRVGVVTFSGLLEAVEVSLDRRSKPPVLDALTLGAKDSLFL